MKPRRRMTFQLTPLLDLLLIVIFAQFMEVQQQAESAQDDLQQQKQQLVQQFDDGKAELERQRADLQREISLQSSTLTERREQYSKQFESILQQHQQAGQALSDAFNLPTTVMEEVLQLQTDGNQTDARNLQQAAKRLKDLLPQRGDELLLFMLRYDEMQKHVSVWELHLQDNGQASFSDGGTAQTVSFGTQEEFLSRAFQTSKSFTDPKSLVIILLTYGDTQAGQLARVVDGMPLLVEQLRRDAGNTRWFDFSPMGFRAGGPLFGDRFEANR
jgi:hypothetical protein